MSRLAWLIAALALAGCDGAPAPAPTWRTALADDGGPLLAAWGDRADDLWLVGGGPGDDGARVVRWTGVATPVAIGRSERLWWVWGARDGTRWLVGAAGLVLRGDDAGFAVVPSATAATLYGVWGSGPDDVWIVGGIANGAADPDDDLVLHWDGAALTRRAVPARGAALFKVWGSAADDVWLSGEQGTLWHWDGAGFAAHHQPTAASILTVAGCDRDEAYAVGGSHVWQWDGATWTEATGLPSLAFVAGVACGPDDVLVVGAQGLRLRRPQGGGAWIDERDAAAPIDLHGAWAGGDGGLMAVGGDYLIAPGAVRRGVAAVRGP
ncbi:MAG: hypothetical protein IPH44_30365 [Myxococcales bacterium]|nr:hypothetical protein [Myxococcales bacterium]